jgi:FAD/FMN-containing dehydrogenase
MPQLKGGCWIGPNRKIVAVTAKNAKVTQPRGSQLRRFVRRNLRHSELFALAIGVYGLFGVIASVTLRLAPRRKRLRVNISASPAQP